MNQYYVLEDGFRILVQDACEKCTILSTTNDLVYRVEVYCEKQLADAIEISMDNFNAGFTNKISFDKQCKQIHQKLMDKYCKKIPENILEEKDIIVDQQEQDVLSKKRDILGRYTEYFYKIKKLLIRKNIFIALFILFVVSLLLFFRPIACSDSLIDIFAGHKNIIDYYEDTEYMCHKLEQRCRVLANTNLDQVSGEDIEQCRLWCKSGIIKNNRCVMFLSLFPREEDSVNMNKIQKMPTTDTRKIKTTLYEFIPDKKLELKLGKHQAIKVVNRSDNDIKVKLKRLELDKSRYDEIVQFEDGNIEMIVKPHAYNSFSIYLEPTYYEQFPKKEYSGRIIFSLYLKNGKSERKVIQFFFKVI